MAASQGSRHIARLNTALERPGGAAAGHVWGAASRWPLSARSKRQAKLRGASMRDWKAVVITEAATQYGLAMDVPDNSTGTLR